MSGGRRGDDGIVRLTTLLRESGALHRVHERAQVHARKATVELERFEPGPARAALQSLPDLLLARDR